MTRPAGTPLKYWRVHRKRHGGEILRSLDERHVASVWPFSLEFARLSVKPGPRRQDPYRLNDIHGCER